MCYERLCPADVVFVEQIRKVGVVNNTPAVQQDYEQVDYASASLEGDGAVTVEALAQEVASAEYFDEVVVYDKQFRRSSYPLDQPIPKATVDELLHLLDVDMLLSMERVNVVLKDTSMIIPEVFVKVPAVEGGVVSDGGVCAVEVVVDGSRQADTWDVMLCSDHLGSGKRAVSSDHDEGVDSMSLYVLIRACASFFIHEVLASRGTQDSTSTIDGSADAFRCEILDFVIDEAFPATVDSLYLPSVIDGRTCDGSDRRVHSGSITS